MRQKTVFMLVAVSLAVSFLVAAAFHVPQRSGKPEVSPDLSGIRSGDLVFRQGRGLFSGIFRTLGGGGSPFSHVGIVLVEQRELFVIHTEASELTGVGCAKKERLRDFIDSVHASKYAFYRVSDLDDADIDAVLRSASGYVASKVPFDTDFDLGDDERLYCTELVYKAYKAAGIDLVGQPSRVRLPDGTGGSMEIPVITLGQLLHAKLVELGA